MKRKKQKGRIRPITKPKIKVQKTFKPTILVNRIVYNHIEELYMNNPLDLAEKIIFALTYGKIKDK